MKRYLGKPLFRETGLPNGLGAVMIRAPKHRGRQTGVSFYKPTEIRMLARHPNTVGLRSMISSEHALYMILFISNGGGW